MNNNLSLETIIKELEDNNIDVAHFAYEDYDPLLLINQLGTIKEVDQYGGEGMGGTWYSVRHFVNYDTYIKISGFYSSYDGVDFGTYKQCMKIVTPKEKTITIYE